MNVEPQVYPQSEYGYAVEFPELAAKTKASWYRLSTALNCLWSFYEAMHQGKPLPQADTKLAQLGRAVRGNRQD